MKRKKRSKSILSLLMALTVLVSQFSGLRAITVSAAASDAILHYEMKERGNVVVDSRGSYDGTLVGNTGWVTGFNGYAVQLAGGEDYIKVPNEALTRSDAVTISAWIKADSLSNWTSLFVAGTAGNQNNYAILAAQGTPFGNGVGLTMAIKENGGDEIRVAAPANTTLKPNEWTLVTYSQDNTTATLYLNNTQVAQINNMQGSIKGVLEASADTDARLGDNHIFGDPSLVGAIGEVTILDHAITMEELSAVVEEHADVIALQELTSAADSIDLGDLSDVTKDLALETTAAGGVTITWSSDNESYITPEGNVTLPSAADGDKEVTLTAVFSSDKTEETVEKTFTVTLLAPTDERAVQKGAAYVQRYVDYMINDGYTLLTGDMLDAYTGMDLDCDIQWELVEGEADIVDGKIIKTAYAAEREPVKLLAVVSKGQEIEEVYFENVTLLDAYAGYILSFFGGDDNAQKLHLGYSYDGIHWQKLNDGKTVLPTTLGNGNVRDPYIMRKKDGSFAVIATQGWDTNSIYLWDSEDLVTYTNERLTQVTYGNVAGLTGARAWAPEASYDPIKDEYVIYWSDPYASGNNGKTYANTSPDLNTFSQPFVLFDAGYQIIDANIIKWHGSYYMVFKDERGNNTDGGGGKHILMAKSDSLEPGTFKQYTGAITEAPVEGPFMFKANGEDKWYHYFDYFNEHKFGVSVTTDLDSGEWTFLGKSTTMPTDTVQHGGVIAVTQNELTNILKGYGLTETITGVVEPSPVNADTKTAFDDLQLPTTIEAVTEAGNTAVPVIWSADGYDADTEGTYILTGTITGDYEIAEDVAPPAIQVTLVTKEAEPGGSGSEDDQLPGNPGTKPETKPETQPENKPEPTPDTRTLSAPAIKSAKSSAKKTGMVVKVTVNPVANADKYEIYRVQGNKTTLVGTTKSGKTSLEDKNVTKNTVSYYAVAISADGKIRSTNGAALKVRLEKATSVKKATGIKGGIKLTWKKSKSAKKYVVYRSTKKNSGYTKIATVKKNRTYYVDKKAKKGKKYYYKVAVVGNKQMSPLSKPSKAAKRK